MLYAYDIVFQYANLEIFVISIRVVIDRYIPVLWPALMEMGGIWKAYIVS